MLPDGLPGERLQLRIGNDHLFDTGGDHMREHRLDDQPVAAEGVRETCLAKLGRLPGELVIEREDVRFHCFINPKASCSRMTVPERIICLTEETVETLYLLGEQDRIVGITGYAVRPPEARRDKPKVSAFTSAKIDKILDLRPDLVLTFSDLQADIAAELIRHGIELHAFNQRSVDGILAMIRTVGALVGATDRAERLVDQLRARVDGARRRRSAATPPATAGVLRGVGRAADLRHRLGIRADRHRRW